MSTMYCPRCGREVGPSSDDVRFCRYCGLSLDDTKDVIHGSKIKRRGAAYLSSSYFLICFAFIILNIGLELASGSWPWFVLVIVVASLLIMLSVTLGVFGTMMIYDPGQFMKGSGSTEGRSDVRADSRGRGIDEVVGRGDKSLPPPQVVPIASHLVQEVRTAEMAEPPRVTEDTTQKLGKRSDPE